jgi:hypothetical protein
MKDQHEFVFPDLRPDQWTLTPMLGAYRAGAFRNGSGALRDQARC